MRIFQKALIAGWLPVSALWAQDPFVFHAYIQGRFTNQEGTPDRLEIRRARLIFSGDPVSDLSYSFQADLAKAPYIMDAALTWKRYRAFRFTAGQFKIPFSAESLISDNWNTPIARARAVNSLAPGRDTGVQGRDTGLQISGTLPGSREPFVDYAVGVFRGQTLIYSPQAHYHAVAARAIAHPVSGLSAGADWYGSFDSTGTGPGAAVKRRSDAEGEYDRGPLKLRAEQIFARDGKLNRRGGYGLGAWRFSKTWEALARADWITTNTAKPNATSIAYLAGMNYYWGRYLKVGFNAGAQHDQRPGGFSSVTLAQVMVYY
ncbi:MAG TPA: porin [Bryobacteraceae bacterium]|nr:porin [Bryobacteraceae bacterium]